MFKYFWRMSNFVFLFILNKIRYVFNYLLDMRFIILDLRLIIPAYNLYFYLIFTEMIFLNKIYKNIIFK